MAKSNLLYERKTYAGECRGYGAAAILMLPNTHYTAQGKSLLSRKGRITGLHVELEVVTLQYRPVQDCIVL